MAETKKQEEQQEEEHHLFPPSSTSSSSSSSFMLLLKNLMSKRRTWVFLFFTVYTILLSISWNFVKSVLSWYESAMKLTPTSALYGSMVLGLAFGVLSIVAALIVVVPATFVTWITILVLLTFAGRGRRDLVMEGKKLTAEISGFVLRVLIREGNLVAVICAVLGYFALVRRNKEEGIDY